MTIFQQLFRMAEFYMAVRNFIGFRESICVNVRKFAAIRQTVTAIWQFLIFKIEAVRHLEFVVRMLGPPTKSIWCCLTLCKMWLDRCSSFDNMQVVVFCEYFVI